MGLHGNDPEGDHIVLPGLLEEGLVPLPSFVISLIPVNLLSHSPFISPLCRSTKISGIIQGLNEELDELGLMDF